MSDHPAKKQRLRIPQDTIQPNSKTTLSVRSGPNVVDNSNQKTNLDHSSTFDRSLIASVIGEELSNDALVRLQAASAGNLERAINMYFDGSWKTAAPQRHQTTGPGQLQLQLLRKRPAPDSVNSSCNSDAESKELKAMPSRRYIGAFGVGAWATRTGAGLVGHGQVVSIERQKIQSQPQGAKRAYIKQRKTQDIVVRFTNSKGQEIGRLPQDTAAFVSTLIDQKICSFEGVCVFAPDKIRTNDTIYLQLRCFLLRTAFERKFSPVDNNRVTDIFAAKETEDEKAIRLRQVGMVKLFSEIKLGPSKATEVSEKQKRNGILKAVEEAEKNEYRSSLAPEPKEQTSDSGDEEEGKELEQDQLDALYKKAQSFDFDSPEAEPPNTFAMELRPYQKQALHWLCNKEKSHSDRDNVSMHPLWEEYLWPIKDQDDNDVPRVADLDKFYVNPYSGEMSLEFPRQEQNCLGGILADEMGLGKTIEMLALIHCQKAEAAGAPKSYKSTGMTSGRSTTLVVAPMSLLSQWESEAGSASKPGTLKCYVYYGNDKKANLQTLVNNKHPPDLIITSYGTVLSEYGQAAGPNGTARGGLFSINFYRVILDEAHHIKNRISKTARACYEIRAQHRWVLTGTPIVNRLEDLFSLVRFLRVDPWQNFSFWKTFITMPFEAKDFFRALDVVQTVLEPLVLRRTKDMKRPDGKPLVSLPPKSIIIERVKLSKQERDVYDHIQDRAKKSFTRNLEAGTLLKSYTTILAQILRLRQSCCHPNLIRRKELLENELEAEAAYDAANGLSDDMDLHALLDKFSVEETETKSANAFGSHVLKQIRDDTESECPFCCAEPMEDRVVTGCFHSACKACWANYMEHERKQQNLPLCLVCREPINERDLFEIVKEEMGETKDGSYSQPDIILRRVNNSSSSKINALIQILKTLRKTEPDMKCCVFSQFTTFLDLMEPILQRERIPFVRFDGSMQQQQRATVLDKFRAHEGRIILLISLRAGGVGLNLTQANRVFMMDPWWSFAIEAQAIDRVHRMGQTSKVTVHRFVVEESVEERMVNKIQARKKFIASSLGMMSDEEKKQARIDDIKDLLND